MAAKYKVTDRITGEVHYLTAEELAHYGKPKRPLQTVPSTKEERKRSKWSPIPENLDRATAIKLIREALRKRSGRAWSVTGGSGTAYGWLRIDTMPAHRKYDSDGHPGGHYMSMYDRQELQKLLSLDHPCHYQGESVPSSSAHYREYINRARGLPFERAGQYWD